MAYNSKIGWTDHTFNPWLGCHKISQACKFCYAEQMMDKQYGKVEWGIDTERKKTSIANWKKPLMWDKQCAAAEIRQRVFCASLADVFEDNDQLVEWRKELFELIKATPNLDWLLLTKRPECISKFLPEDWGEDGYANVWLGATIESQEEAILRIPHLVKNPCQIHFISAEPLLGPLDLSNKALNGAYNGMSAEIYNPRKDEFEKIENYQEEDWIVGLDWIICGGESGPGNQIREMNLDWVEDIVDICDDQCIPVFVKQLGKVASKKFGISGKGEDMSLWPKKTFRIQKQEIPNYNYDPCTYL